MNERISPIYEFDEFRLDTGKRLLTKGDGEAIPLTPKVFDALHYLVRNSAKVVGKDELMSEIWSDWSSRRYPRGPSEYSHDRAN
jgi:DNA-binding winged helix-turn-helix (wHTH) protein